jgi:hypothetical protein
MSSKDLWGIALAIGCFIATATAAAPAALSHNEARRIALEQLRTGFAALGLEQSDVDDVVVADLYTSKHTGVTHVYLRQRFDGIEIAGADMTISVGPDGRASHLGHHFLAAVATRVESSTAILSATDAMERAASECGAMARGATFTRDEVPPALVYHATEKDGRLRLAWDVVIDAPGDAFSGRVLVDAQSGEVLEQVDWSTRLAPANALTVHGRDTERGVVGGTGAGTSGAGASLSPDSYEVFAIPKEYPDDGPRTLELDPALDGGIASPFGWHDTDGAPGAEYTITRGNNAHAYTDVDNNNLPDPGSSPDGGPGLEFSFPLDLTASPTTYRPASVTNAFYWVNVIHDVLWQHGFDEPAGSFQENNYDRGGMGDDPVHVEVQNGGATNNANFSTLPDGSPGRMQLYVWTFTSPARDGALANLVTTWAYTNGVANRLVGGPSTVSCLTAQESGSMTIGWSDWMGLVLTADESETATTSRGVGTYLLGEPPTGPGFRIAPYTTNMAVNFFTYGDISGLQVPHGVGTVWGTMLWEVYWELVGIHGFNPDIYGDWTTGGNNLALQLVIDGMKLGPCTPGFVDGRDAILLADELLTGAANRCAIWEAFARRGLGFSADQGSAHSTTDGTEAFDLPSDCLAAAVRDEGAGQLAHFDHDLRSRPNPFNPRTTLSFVLDGPGVTAIEIYDVHGRLLRTIDGGALGAGRHEWVWDGRDDADRALASGEYIVRLTVDGSVAATRKAILVK